MKVKKWSDMYVKGYQNAMYFAYIPDFKNQEDIFQYTEGYRDGKGEVNVRKHSANQTIETEK